MTGLTDWTARTVADTCRPRYRAYHADVRRRHIEHFAKRPKQRSPTHAFAAATLEDALPDGWERLAPLIPAASLHRHHLSGGSSQTLALGLLGPAVIYGKGLEWLFEPNGPFTTIGQPVTPKFEYSVGLGLLNEQPRTTDIDFFVSGPAGVVAVEAKFTEEGMGTCSCAGRNEGKCDDRVLGRPYWKVAREVFGLSGPNPPEPCQLSFAYQVVRNTAAVLEMTGLREVAAFGVFYDARNPYFAGEGEWPGWARLLPEFNSDNVVLRAVSWQELIPLLPQRGRRAVFEWAAEKHGLTAD